MSTNAFHVLACPRVKSSAASCSGGERREAGPGRARQHAPGEQSRVPGRRWHADDNRAHVLLQAGRSQQAPTRRVQQGRDPQVEQLPLGRSNHGAPQQAQQAQPPHLAALLKGRLQESGRERG